MNPSSSPSPTPAPLEDIVGPVSYFPYAWWQIALAGAALLLVLALAAWLFLAWRRRRKTPPTARERALAQLGAARGEAQSMPPYDLGVRASDILRAYIEEEFGLQATTQTSIEFLNSIRTEACFSDDEKASLALFLERADLLKFARADASSDEVESLIATAEALVRAGAPQQKQ